MWKTGSKKTILYDQILKYLKEVSSYKHEIILGTDSQPFHTGTFLVSAIAILCDEKEYHCKFFYKLHEQRPIHHNLYERIFSEAQTTIEIAGSIRNEIPQANITIHLDVSHENTKNKTSRFSTSLISMVKGYGYENVEVKPNAWCASQLADRYTKRIPSWLK